MSWLRFVLGSTVITRFDATMTALTSVCRLTTFLRKQILPVATHQSVVKGLIGATTPPSQPRPHTMPLS